MTNTTNPARLADQCGVTVTLTRADQLTLGAKVALSNWDGNVTLGTVVTLALLNDDVEVTTVTESQGLTRSTESLMSVSTLVTVLTGTTLA